MFLTANLNPTPLKHRLYIISSILLGLLLSIMAHAVIEEIYLSWATDSGRTIVWYGSCALHPAIQIGLLALGALAGYGLGRMWWRMVYIDRRWAKGILNNKPQSNEPTSPEHQ
ncbi:MAG: hypothetical protein HZC01_02430 [Candidatus Kerfeldbacteria bacterium]|nr:hypothetical protein [Candidatus Kerfeldbacteria bacterium]